MFDVLRRCGTRALTDMPQIPPLQRVPAIHSSDARGRFWGRLDVSDVPELAHHCRTRGSWGIAWRAAGRAAAVWQKGDTLGVDRLDWCVSIRLNDGVEFAVPFGLELRFQFHQQRHVCRAVQLYP